MTVDHPDLSVGADFGGTKILATLVDRKGGVVAEHRVPTPHDGEQLLDALAGVIKTLEEHAGGTVAGIGVGAAGLVDRAGVLHYGPNVGGISEVDVQGGLEKRLPGQIVKVDNDANVAAWGECLFGAGQRKREMLMVTLGTGIGGGMVAGGRLFRGQNGFAAEIGHMTLVADGVLCACGKHGCWEAYASGRALGQLGRVAATQSQWDRGIAAAGSVEAIRGEHVTKAARAGDLVAQSVMKDFARWVAIGAASMVSLLDPEIIVIGGGLAEEHELFLDHTREYMQEMTFGAKNRPPVEIVVAGLGERAGSVGAAMLVHGDEMEQVDLLPQP